MTHSITSIPGLVESVIDCMEIASQRRPGRFDCRRAALYTGLQCEELAEKLMRLAPKREEEPWKNLGLKRRDSDIVDFAMMLQVLGNRFKSGEFDHLLQNADHAGLIDDDFDIAWVSIGALEATSTNAHGAIAHGTLSNLAKFPERKAILDANGKFMKPPGWQRPDFTPYTDPTRGID